MFDGFSSDVADVFAPVMFSSPVPFLPLYLQDGTFAIVDAIDFPAAAQWLWHSNLSGQGKVKRGRTLYARRKAPTRMYLHVWLVTQRMKLRRPKNAFIVDHKNGNGLDCRRCNLHWVTEEQNRANRR